MQNRLLLSIAAGVALAAAVTANQRVLLYTAVASDGYYHPSIPDAVKALRKLGDNFDVDMVHCNNREDFADLNLTQFDALAFVSAAGSILTKKGTANMREYIANGGGYIGIHEASCAATNTPWYLRLVGAQFTYHPEITHATMDVLVSDHPSTQHLGETWEVYDEIYNFASDPRDVGATVLLGADESTYWDKIEPASQRAKVQGSPHPISWFREGNLLSHPGHVKLGGGLDNKKSDVRKGIAGKGGPGRSWYTALGHSHACWKKEEFLQHVWGGFQWVLASPSLASNNASSAAAPGQTFNGSLSTVPTLITAGASKQTALPAPVQNANKANSTGSSSDASLRYGQSPAAVLVCLAASSSLAFLWTTLM
ncbi:unnamed protein product [Parajaminaea phylloscopi]